MSDPSRKRRASELDGDHDLIVIAESLEVSTVEVCCCDRVGGINLAEHIRWSGRGGTAAEPEGWYCLECKNILPTAADKETLIHMPTGTRKDGMIDSGTKEVLKQLDDKPKKYRE